MNELEELREEIKQYQVRDMIRLRAVVKFLMASGHDLCHENRRELAAAFGLECGPPDLPSEEEFARRCDEYRRQLYGPEKKT